MYLLYSIQYFTNLYPEYQRFFSRAAELISGVGRMPKPRSRGERETYIYQKSKTAKEKSPAPRVIYHCNAHLIIYIFEFALYF